MKGLYFTFLFSFLFFTSSINAVPIDSIAMPQWAVELEKDISKIKSRYQMQRGPLVQELKATNAALQATFESEATLLNTSAKVDLLLKKMMLQEELEMVEAVFEVDLTKKRYKKGIDLIKMLYEKLLALDHHFSSLKTYQNVMSLSNPNSFPEFQKTKEILKGRLKKDNKLNVPSLLSTNPLISTTYSLVASLIGGGNTVDREKDLGDISCILDFTATMSSELSTIFYETEFLKENNLALKKECLELFLEYTKVIGYFTTLDKCRKEDDWENLYETLDEFSVKMEEDIKTYGMTMGSKGYKKQIDLEFSVDRLLEFINKYNNFISQGEKYYKKFKIIVSNYPNEAACLDQLPPQFTSLQSEIDNSIHKFNIAYDISELTGSKLKDLLYGLPE